MQIDDQPLFTVERPARASARSSSCAAVATCSPALAQIAPQVDVEAVLARDPQVILSTDDTRRRDPRALWRRWPQLDRRAQRRRSTRCPSDLVARATPRLAQGAHAACSALDDARRRLAPRLRASAAGLQRAGLSGRLSAAGAARAPRCRARDAPARARSRTAGRTGG
ncbi:MAG: hypothetical protein MZV65_17580 [Chromatiales bacterium]|nr:hypothetical protein [Chromatiales bacterium]